MSVVSYDSLRPEQKADLMVRHLNNYKNKFNGEAFKGLAILCKNAIDSLGDSEMREDLKNQYNNILNEN